MCQGDVAVAWDFVAARKSGRCNRADVVTRAGRGFDGAGTSAHSGVGSLGSVMSLADDVALERAAAHRRMFPPLALCSLGYVLAYIVSLGAVESVMGSGPLLFGLGLWLLSRGRRAQSAAAGVLGAGLCVLTVSLVAVVNVLDWSPVDAREPFALIGAAAGIAVVVLAVFALREPRRPAPVELREALAHATL